MSVQVYELLTKVMKSAAFTTLACVLTTATLINTQQFNISQSLNAFGLNLLRETVNQADDSLNVALSTSTAWTLLAIIAEGSLEDTARQLEKALEMPENKAPVRSSYQNYTDTLLSESDGIRLELNSAIFTNKEFPVKKSFQTLSEQSYKVAVNPLNFKEPTEAAILINKYIAQSTKNRITNFVVPEDLVNAQLLLTSILYFKGEWQTPFNKSATSTEPFYDENEKKIGEVEMMFRAEILPFARLENLNAFAVELPYGLDGKMSMVVILPFKGNTVYQVLNGMTKMPFDDILKSLENSRRRITDDILIYLPRFKVSSDFTLNVVLNKIGIEDVFRYDKANLLGIFDNYLFLSRLIQKAEIEVTEEGTVATAATGAFLQNKSPSPRFKADRPFLYFIVDKPTRSIIFSGKISNPNTLK